MREYYKSIDGAMFDFEDYYLSVAQWIPNPARIVEVGLGSGKSCIFLAEAILNLGKSIERFIVVDNCEYGGTHQRNEIITNLVKSGLGNKLEFYEMSSLDASTKFPDGYFHYAFIDSSHKFNQTQAEIRLWQYKLLHDGVLAGHDIFSKQNPEVGHAVKGLIPSDRLYTTDTRDGHGIWSTVKNDNLPCF